MRNIGTLAVSILLVTSAYAGDVAIESDGGMTWQAGVDGVEIEWNPDNSVKRIYSRYGTPVEFSDRRGIRKAQIIAEEKAKAAIIRFMDQSVSSTRVGTEIDQDINEATQVRENGGEASFKKVDQRKMIENLTGVTSSFAAGKLRGVIVLEQGYDEKAGEAWIVVGISDKTIAAARGVKEMTTASEKARSQSGASKSMHQGTEVRRSHQKDW